MIEPDATLGGYLDQHDRPPAFEGSDGASYSVSLYVNEEIAPHEEIGGSLLFVRWSDDGAQPVGHVETGYLVRSTDADEVKSTLLSMPLMDVKRELDTALAARKQLPDW